MKPSTWLVVTALALLPSMARSDVVMVTANQYDPVSCGMSDPGPGGLVLIYVVHSLTLGATRVAFSAPVPADAGLIYLGETSNYTVSGNSQTGADVSYGDCLVGNTIVVMTLYFQRTTSQGCSYYLTSPHPQLGLTSWDCASVEHPAVRFGTILFQDGSCPYVIPATNPGPADGATNVPLMTELTWDPGLVLCGAVAASPAAVCCSSLYFGTSPNPPYVGDVASPYSVGPLTPATTYYWYIFDNEWYTAGPVWSFTTTDEQIAVRPTTWGAIKALYR